MVQMGFAAAAPGHARLLPLPAEVHGRQPGKRRLALPGSECLYNIDIMGGDPQHPGRGGGDLKKLEPAGS